MNDMTGEGMSFSIRQLFYALASFFVIIFLLYLGRPVVVPLAFAFLIFLILCPVSRFFEKAAFLAIVPYVGAALLGDVPALYAFMNWYPEVILMLWFIRIMEDEIPVEKKVKMNI
ncbi:hypothetical protein C900_05327 [Fulvivirga imtechensis AK7]|uniref:Uncharacterized protein n=1 Tax=Fulvivirga imtechensis AK7 TaxID=1237149 RepID=L8JK43_9BACT|nr:hypothetical protein [Fulvivirga imtechensis]ELR69256.1 hypothetical protein C900_05327 [Fulvivirga imtechensis AK7]